MENLTDFYQIVKKGQNRKNTLKNKQCKNLLK